MRKYGRKSSNTPFCLSVRLRMIRTLTGMLYIYQSFSISFITDPKKCVPRSVSSFLTIPRISILFSSDNRAAFTEVAAVTARAFTSFVKGQIPIITYWYRLAVIKNNSVKSRRTLTKGTATGSGCKKTIFLEAVDFLFNNFHMILLT